MSHVTQPPHVGMHRLVRRRGDSHHDSIAVSLQVMLHNTSSLAFVLILRYFHKSCFVALFFFLSLEVACFLRCVRSQQRRACAMLSNPCSETATEVCSTKLFRFILWRPLLTERIAAAEHHAVTRRWTRDDELCLSWSTLSASCPSAAAALPLRQVLLYNCCACAGAQRSCVRRVACAGRATCGSFCTSCAVFARRLARTSAARPERERGTKRTAKRGC